MAAVTFLGSVLCVERGLTGVLSSVQKLQIIFQYN